MPKSMPAEPNYRPAVVTFLDILGFRDLVRTKSAEELKHIVSLVQRFAGKSEENDGMDEEDHKAFEHTRSVVFSDSVVRIRCYDTEYPSGALFHEVIDLVHAQTNLIAHGVLVRGGISHGEVHDNGEVVFGPAFVRAYDLESQFANFPRIVLGPEVFQGLRSDPRMRANHHDLEDEIRYQSQLLRRGDDGFWFIDYLFAARHELDEPAEYPDLLVAHRDLVIKQALSAPASSRVLQKFLWMAGYHNSVCERTGFGDFVIGRRDIPALEDLADTPEWAGAEEFDPKD